MGGRKRKIRIEKIEDKETRAVSFSKRRYGLYSKTAELCLLAGGSQVAIIAAPVSANSNFSFYGFGHSSPEIVVSAFLNNERPPPELGFRRWWEDEAVVQSKDANVINSAIDAVRTMMRDVEALRLQVVEKQKAHHQEEASTSTRDQMFNDDEEFVEYLDEVLGPHHQEEHQTIKQAFVDHLDEVIATQDQEEQDQEFADYLDDILGTHQEDTEFDHVQQIDDPEALQPSPEILCIQNGLRVENAEEEVYPKELALPATPPRQEQAFNQEFGDLDGIFDSLTNSKGLFENWEMDCDQISVATTSQIPWSDPQDCD